MDLFKEKMETWQGKLVRLKTDCRTGEHIYPKGLLMRIDCVSTKKVRLQTLPCATCGIIDFMTIKECKSAKEDLAQGFKECMRVLKNNGTLIFKWSEAQISLSEILSCFDKEPLLMQKSSRTSHFCVFYKE